MAKQEPEIRIVEDAQEVARAAAAEFIDRAREAVATRGFFTVALSGGKTPRLLYDTLARETAAGTSIPWKGMHLFWGDERSVPPGHPDSNYRMVQESLLDRIDLPAGQVHRIPTGAGSAADAAARYESELRSFFAPAPGEAPRFDLILLGLGGDGHTASLFPGSAAVQESQRWVVAERVASLGSDRVSLTLPVINHAARVLFLVTGQDKAEALRSVLRGKDPVDRLPARGVRPVNGTLLWLVDRSAARLLSSDGRAER
jgi:6-phosphogluconolactonase